jgi:hypothetical protein
MDQWDAVALRKRLDVLDVLLADLPESGRRWDADPPLPPEKDAHLSHRLEHGNVGLQKDPIERADLEGYVVPQ